MMIRAVSAVHDHARVQEVLRRRATHDALTDLPNRTLLAERLQELLSVPVVRRAPVWLLYLDVDGFKLVNDTWGHETGDQLLVEVARRLADVAPDGITVARTGGDEFALAGQLARQDVERLADRVLGALQDPLDGLGLDLVAGSGRIDRLLLGRGSAAGRRHGDVPGQERRLQRLGRLRRGHAAGRARPDRDRAGPATPP